MVSPEHVDEQKPEDQPVLSPAEEKQVLPVSEKKRPWIEFLLRVVAIVVSLIGGAAFYSFMVLVKFPSLENPPSEPFGGLPSWAFLLVFLVGMVGGAMLFRSWWAILFIPLALGIGAYVVSYQIPKLIPLNDYDSEVVYAGAAMESWLILPILAIIGACIGSFLGVLWKKGWEL